MRVVACLAGILVLALSGEGSREAPRCPTDIEYVYYMVSGATLGEIKSSIRARGPVDPDGARRYAKTEWRIQWSWGKKAVGGIDPGTVRVSCRAKVTLPQHQSAQQLSSAERARWDRYRAVLEQHEMNHVRHVEVIAPQISRRVAAQQARYGHVSAKTAQAIARGVLHEIHELDRAYDRNTRHGATEGV